mgnify:CR=1 FL=1
MVFTSFHEVKVLSSKLTFSSYMIILKYINYLFRKRFPIMCHWQHNKLIHWDKLERDFRKKPTKSRNDWNSQIFRRMGISNNTITSSIGRDWKDFYKKSPHSQGIIEILKYSERRAPLATRQCHQLGLIGKRFLQKSHKDKEWLKFSNILKSGLKFDFLDAIRIKLDSFVYNMPNIHNWFHEELAIWDPRIELFVMQCLMFFQCMAIN